MTDNTPGQRIWKSFKRNRLAVGGLLFVTLSVLMALLGYLVMPDSTPDANDMHLQLSIKKPGSKFTLLLIKKPEYVESVNFFSEMIWGQPAAYRSVPVTSYSFKGDSVYVDQYIGSEDKPEKGAFNIYEVALGKKVTFDKHGVMVILGEFKNEASNAEALRKRFRDEIVQNQIVNKTYWLGTDLYGRDLLSRIILGARISLSVGLVAVIISLVLGVVIGAAAGYYGGKTDAALGWVMNVLWALPALLLVIAISFALGKGLWQIYIAVGISMWVDVARLVRGQVMSEKQFEFVEAAHALGFTNYRIIWRHILPNIVGPILVLASSNFASAILLEAGLSFLGFGAQPPTPTWGGMIKEHYGYIIMDDAYLAVLPGLAIMLMVYAFNLVTIGLRDAFDIKSDSLRI
ncbi:peptide/nickel transport system permease protein [Mucilaginibacter gracilis]|uniref:Peptide/nickel transport system permease protein n=1 Tax=Mucilaginibacter gracilis TaxID=423350 RepID=A0A495IXV8_9SPHI|nr:ABC transporter permease [Mucilaginibacter gracilis]RKR81525.1 peptide/nickel transport system permease protein [Mucilaginibacter gracilis]